jgi:PAS domain S-box-containing protein
MGARASNKVLIVGDEQDVRKRLASILEQSERYEPLQAADGRDALQAILNEAPDFVLLSYELPVLSGIEVLQALEYVFEERPELSKIMVVALTSKQGSWKRHEVEHRYIADYLSDTCDAYRLLRTLDNLGKARESKARVEAERYKKQGIKMLFSAIMDVTQEGFLLVNREGSISYANAAASKILGLKPGQSLYGEHIGTILGDELAELLVGNSAAEKVLADVSRKTVRLSRYQGDRSTIINFTLYPYHGPDGNESGIIFHLRDLEMLRQELERANAVMSNASFSLQAKEK